VKYYGLFKATKVAAAYLPVSEARGIRSFFGDKPGREGDRFLKIVSKKSNKPEFSVHGAKSFPTENSPN
jgi:hypothetical protein